MTIESPETYGDHFWHSQTLANELIEESLEESIKPFIPRIFGVPEIRDAVPFDILSKLENLLEFPSAGLGAIGGRFVSEIADSLVTRILDKPLRKLDQAANRTFPNMIMSPEQAFTLYRRKKVELGDFEHALKSAGLETALGKLIYEGTAPFPTIPELLRWARYHGAPDNTWATLADVVDLDPINYNKWDWLSRQQLTTDQITALYKRGTIEFGTADLRLQEAGWLAPETGNVIDLAYVIPNAMLLLQGNLFAKAGEKKIFEDLGHADIHLSYQQQYYDAVLTKPASSDLVAYHLRQENELANLGDDLKRIGIHPEYTGVYRTLADRIPPVADIIMMAVREAFSPGIAARFGQYEDFPREFARYAKMQGLSEEWAERYWAAHWGLPSPQQGFEMLHRGVIDRDDLDLLMKAQDIMPFWREKMVQIAYRPLTRVDVRRMYKEGILSEEEVFTAYRDHGYSHENAKNMTEFTIAYVLTQQSKFTAADVVKAYTQRMIDNNEARSLLIMLGVRSRDTRYILETADYKREWALMNAKTGAIRNLYKRGEYQENQARDELLRLGLPSVQVDTLMETWWYEAKEDPPRTWSKAETMKFVKIGLIDENRGRQELQVMGYDQEHIDVYMRQLTWTPPTD